MYIIEPKKKDTEQAGCTSWSEEPACSTKMTQILLSTLPHPTWYYTKGKLLEAIQVVSNQTYLASVDSKYDSGTKKFTVFSCGKDIVAYIESLKNPHVNEVIYDTQNYPCYLYFDLDQKVPYVVTPEIYGTIVERFVMIFTKFLKDIYHQEIRLEIGKNMHIAYTKSPHKISLHIKMNIVFPNLQAIKILVTNLDKYMCSQNTSEEDRAIFYAYENNKYIPLIDQSVYGNFRSYRTLLSSKWKQGGLPLLPWGNSSIKVEDHLVRVYHDIPQNSIHVNIPHEEVIIVKPNSSSNNACKKISCIKATTNDNADQNIHEIIPHIPKEEENQVKQFILTSPHVIEMLGTTNFNFKYERYVQPHILSLPIDKECMCSCPYAQRTHLNNRSYFEYNSLNKTVTYKCFNEQCKTIQKDNAIMFVLNFGKDASLRLSSLQPEKSLHCKQDVIHWNEVYKEPTMNPYPLQPITCIRANMGACKTQCLVRDFIPTHCMHHDTKCLIITYQILLSKKYDGALEACGFTNYLDVAKEDTHLIYDNKVIVCLDSLWRVATRNFDFVFIDEVLSVLLHFNSPLIKRISTISTLFELLLLQAKYVYLLDACVDNTMVYNFVNYLALIKSVEPYWIRNTYIRPSNRNANIIVNKNFRKSADLHDHVKQHVCDLLKSGKKVVVSSSTKSFTERLEETINIVFNKEKKTLVYNSATDKNIIHKHATNPNDVWKEYDVLIYSPSITAGISFEVPHFDELVCYLVNSFYTPTVDLSLQQMFRVRQLVTGNMHIYVNDTLNVNKDEYPIGDNEIEKFLDHNISSLSKYFPDDTVAFESTTVVTRQGIGYDKNRLSYNILKGIIACKNKSGQHFADILKNTLEQDYNISCSFQKFGDYKDHLKKCLSNELCTVSTKNAPPRIHDEVGLKCLKINGARFEELRDKDIAMEALTPEERMQMHVYHMAVEVWGVSISKVDMKFFENFINYYDNKEKVEAIYDKLYSARRLCDLLNFDEQDNQHRMHSALKEFSVGGNEDGNIKLYRSRIKTYYVRLLEGTRLLRTISGSTQNWEKCLQSVRDNFKVALKSTDIKENFKTYLQGLTKEHFETIQKHFGLPKRTYTHANLEKKHVAFVKNVLSVAFAMDVSTVTRGTQNKAKKTFGVNCEKVGDVSWLGEFIQRYSPSSVKVYAYPSVLEDANDDLVSFKSTTP